MNGAEARLAGVARLLYVGPFVTMFDRFSIAPMLIPIARDLHVSVGQVTIVATVYFLLYGAMQIAYGLLSDRFGRIRLMRTVLFGVAASGAVSALAPNLGVLVLGRALTGSLVCAIVPATLVYVGDSFPFGVRQRVIADVLAAVALGTTAATLGAGLLAGYATWRLVFLLPALVALGLAFALGRLPEASAATIKAAPLARLRQVAGRPWMIFLAAVGVAEGAAILGFLTFLAPALEAHGQTAAVAGLVVAAYGVAVLGGTRVAKALASRTRPHVLILLGGACLVGGYLCAAGGQDVVRIGAASLLVGLSYAVMHSTFQTWATEVVPASRGTATALFVTAAFLGAGLGTALLSGLADAGLYGTLFTVAAAVSAPMVVIGALGRWRFPEHARHVPEPEPVPAS